MCILALLTLSAPKCLARLGRSPLPGIACAHVCVREASTRFLFESEKKGYRKCAPPFHIFKCPAIARPSKSITRSALAQEITAYVLMSFCHRPLKVPRVVAESSADCATSLLHSSDFLVSQAQPATLGVWVGRLKARPCAR